MAISLVQNSASVARSASPTTATLPANSTAGNFLVAFIGLEGQIASLTITGPSGWSQADNQFGNQNGVAIWYYPNTVGGQSSFQFSNSNGNTMQIVVAEFSGVSTSAAVDTKGNATGTSSPLSVTTAGNVSASGELAVGVCLENETKSGTTTMGAGTGWTDVLDNGGTSLTSHVIATDKIGPTSGTTLNESFSSSTMNLFGMTGLVVVFTNPNVAPTVTTDSVTSIGATTATVNGNVTSDGGASVTERGAVYATTANPTTSDNKVQSGSGTGTFSANLTGLTTGQQYHTRAYAINSVGTSYGADLTFTPTAATTNTLAALGVG